MAPDNKTNVIFKFILYRLQEPIAIMIKDSRHTVKAGEISDIEVLAGEWNNVERVKVEETDNEGVKSELYKIDAGASDIDRHGAASLWKNLKNRQYGTGLIGLGTISLPQFHPLVNLITFATDGRGTSYKIFRNTQKCDF
jgi:hypothetical protein